MIWFEFFFVYFSCILVGNWFFLIVVEKNHIWFDFIVCALQASPTACCGTQLLKPQARGLSRINCLEVVSRLPESFSARER